MKTQLYKPVATGRIHSLRIEGNRPTFTKQLRSKVGTIGSPTVDLENRCRRSLEPAHRDLPLGRTGMNLERARPCGKMENLDGDTLSNGVGFSLNERQPKRHQDGGLENTDRALR